MEPERTGPRGGQTRHCGEHLPQFGREFFLGWQSWLAGELLESSEVGLGIAPEAGAQRSRLPPLLKALAQGAPTLLADTAQVSPRRGSKARRDSRNQAHRAAQHRPGRSRLAPSSEERRVGKECR